MVIIGPMKKITTIHSLFLILFSFSTFTVSAALTADPLTKEDLESLNKGEIVKKIKWTQNNVWPQVTIYSLIPHKPLENLAAFTDYKSHKTFIPDMLESDVQKKISDHEAHVKFVMKMPWPVSKETHVTDNLISKAGENHYVLTWSLVSADLLKDTTGFLDFQAQGDRTLFTYLTQITPNSSFAGLFKSRVATDVETSVKKIISRLNENINAKDPATMEAVLNLSKTLK
jgi:hypothetical protein